MAVEGGMMSAALGYRVWSWSNFEDSNTFEYCNGYTKPLNLAIAESQGIFHKGPSKFHSVVFPIFLACFLTEIYCYISLYSGLEKKRKANTATTDDMKKWQHKRNTLTLKGQFIQFICEIISTILCAIALFFAPKDMDRMGIVNILTPFVVAFTTVTYFFASPELRRHYFRFEY